MIVRDPIALTVAAPRFLTLGDEARLDLSLHNVEGAAGAYQLAVERLAGARRQGRGGHPSSAATSR